MFCFHSWGKPYGHETRRVVDEVGDPIGTKYIYWQDCRNCGKTVVKKRTL